MSVLEPATTQNDPPTNRPDGERAPRRRWPWLVAAVNVLALVASGFVWSQSRHPELTSLWVDKTWGMSVEVDYAPLLPTTVTGAHLRTDAGDDDGDLYDSTLDDDVPPEQVTARIGHPVSLSFGLLPTCADGAIDDEGTITVQTSSGDRSVSIALPGLASKVAEWCGGDVALYLSTAHADAHGRNVEATYRVVSPRDVVVVVSTPGWKAEPLAVTAGDEAELTVSSAVGCSANPPRLALAAAYTDGTEQQLYAPAPGNEVCG